MNGENFGGNGRARRSLQTWIAALGAVLLVVVGMVAVPAAASAAAITATQTITKAANTAGATVAPGETFSYTFAVTCGSSVGGVTGCGNATIVDLLPEDIEFVSMGPFPSGAPGTATSRVVGGRDEVSITFSSDVVIADGVPTVKGVPLGSFELVMQVRLAADADWEISGENITNTANLTSDNAEPKSASAVVVPQVPVVLDTAALKSFSPVQNFATPGLTTTLTMSGENRTNGGVDTLVVQDPAGADPLPTGATSPFRYLEFTGFGEMTLPAGAASVTAQVWSLTDQTWHTVYSGAGPPVYPTSGAPAMADVYGVRFSYAPAAGQHIQKRAVGTAAVTLAQRDNVLGLPATTVTNTVQSTVTQGEATKTSAPASAVYNIVPYGLQVAVAKDFEPNDIKAGQSADVQISASNAGTAPMTSMTVTEPSAATPDALSGDLTFTGFGTIEGGAGADVEWPSGADSATVVYHYANGTDSAPLTRTTADTLAPVPAGAPRVIGYTLTFAAVAPGTIAPGAEASLPFTVRHTGPKPPTGSPVAIPNEVQATGTDGTATSTAVDSDTLTVYGDQIGVEVGKSLSPAQGWLIPGQQVVAQIPAKVKEFPATTVNPTQVVVEDSVPTSPAWWDLYDVTGFPQLGIPANATLTVLYTTDGGATWMTLAGPLSAPPAYQDVAIGAALASQITGFRFQYDARSGQSFAPGTTFQPNATFTTRDSTRAGVPIADVPTNATNGQGEDIVRTANCASAGASQDTLDLSAPPAVTNPCPVHDLVPIEGGDGPDLFDKALSPLSVTERTQAPVNGTLRWSTGGLTGVAQQSVTETGSNGGAPATAATLPTSYLNAFDVVALPALTKTGDPLLRYDRLVSLELFDYTTGTWTALPGGPWDGATATGDTVFPAYTLTAAQRATTTAVRYIFEESPNRASVLTPGNLTQPAVGSGVASSYDRRSIPITLQLRDVLRSNASIPVLATDTFNAGQVGVVHNTGASTACFTSFSPDGSCTEGQTTTDGADTAILNGTATITTGKTWTGGPIGIPPSGTAPEDYPSTRATLSVVNNGPQKVDSISMAEPAPGVDLTGTAFDSFDLMAIVSVTPPPGATGTLLTLTYADGTTSAPLTPAAAIALSAAQLEDVVGVAAQSTGRIGTGTTDGRLQVAVDLRLRETLRSSTTTPAAPVVAATVPNSMYGAISDPSVEPAGSCAVSPGTTPPANTVIGCSTATTQIVASLGRTVVAGKSFSPTSQYEDQDGNVTMTLSGQPGGPARSNQLVLQDDAAAFWNAYGFAGLPSGFAIASPANRVKIEVLSGATYGTGPGNTITTTGGAWQTVATVSGTTWLSAAQARTLLPAGTEASLITLAGAPSLTYAQVQGIRVTYQRVAAGSINDPAAPLLLFENPATPSLRAAVLVNRRAALLTGGAVPTDLHGNTAAPGTPAAGQFPNTVLAIATGVAGSGAAATDTENSTFAFLHRPTSAQLSKTPTGLQQPGRPFTVTLTVTNNGQYPIIDPVFTDVLPSGSVIAGEPDLVFPAGVDPAADATYAYTLTGTAPVGYSPLPTTSADVNVTLDPGTGDPGRIAFGFAPGSALGVGQTYTISFPLEIRVGAVANQAFVNTLTIDGQRWFDTCNNVGPSADTCSTTASIRTTPVANLGAVQSVRALDDALGVVSANSSTCAPANADPEGFYVFPCTPVTKPGKVDEWRLSYTNTGTYPLDSVQSVVYFPRVGKSGIDIDSGQLSTWTPTLVANSFAGGGQPAEQELFYTTASRDDLCTSVLDPGGSCPAGAWLPLTPTTDLSTVTAVYGIAHFDRAGGPLQPGDDYELTFQTTAPDYAPTPAAYPKTWNSIKSGGTYSVDAQGNPSTNPSTTPSPAAIVRTLAPFESPVVGAALATGSVAIEKTVDGPAADEDWVPVTFTGSLECTSNGTVVPAASTSPVPTLTPGTPVTVSNLPWNASCTFVETDAGSAVTFDPQTAIATDDPAAVQTIGVANTYQYASLIVGKTVTASTGFEVPTQFGFSVLCTFNGDTVLDEDFTLDAGATQEYRDLPARSSCTIAETDVRGADATVMSVDVVNPTAPPVIDQQARTVTIPELSPDSAAGATANTVGAENLFDVGGITITKAFAGGGADQFGLDQTFTADVVCTFGGETLAETSVTLSAGNAWTAAVTGLVVGSECQVTEPDLQGADAVVITPNDGEDTQSGVVVVGSEEQPASVTVTNWYLTGSVEVTKTFAGDGAELFGTADFTLELSCLRDGTAVLIPGGEERIVSASSPTALWTQLPTGAECTLVETDAGGADPTAILDADGAVLVRDASAGYTFTVTTDPAQLSTADQPQPALQVQNTFDLAEVSVTKTVTTDAVDENGDPVAFGPFEVTLACTFNGGDVVAAEPMTQSIADGETIAWSQLPAGADCAVTESDDAGAGDTWITVTQGDTTTDPVQTDTVELDPLLPVTSEQPNAVEIENVFPVAAITIAKSLAGAGAVSVTRTFPVHVVCTLTDASHPDGLVVRDGTFEIGGPSAAVATVPNLPAGAECTVTETDAGGATATAVVARDSAGTQIARADGTAITVTADDAQVDLVFTNTFILPLPPTGASVPWFLLLFGGGLLGAGALLVVIRRRRQA